VNRRVPDRRGHLAGVIPSGDDHRVLSEFASDDATLIMEALLDIRRDVARILRLLEDDDEAEEEEEDA
jgi:hypothetical protein